MAYTLQQREINLQTAARRYIIILNHGIVKYITEKLKEPLDVPNIGYINLTAYTDRVISDNERSILSLVPTWIYLDEWLKELHDQNTQEIAIDSFDFDNIPRQNPDYGTHITIRTRKAMRAILTAWIEKRAELETRTRIYTNSFHERIQQIAGRLPVINSENIVLTGAAQIEERERISTSLRTVITSANIPSGVENVVIPTGFSTDVDEASQQAFEWLSAAAQRKNNWIVNSEDYEIVEPASSDQVSASKSVETERQKGIIAVQRSTTIAGVTSAYNIAKTAIDAVIVNNTPVWKLNTSNTIPLTDGRHVITYATPFTAISYRADNPVIDPEDARHMGEISIDKNISPYFIFTTHAAEGSIKASYGITISRNSTLPNPKSGNYDIDLTARNNCGPTLFKIRIVVPEYALSFTRSTVPAQTFRSGTVPNVQFDAATGGNGKITYSMDDTPCLLYTSPSPRD